MWCRIRRAVDDLLAYPGIFKVSKLISSLQFEIERLEFLAIFVIQIARSLELSILNSQLRNRLLTSFHSRSILSSSASSSKVSGILLAPFFFPVGLRVSFLAFFGVPPWAPFLRLGVFRVSVAFTTSSSLTLSLMEVRSDISKGCDDQIA